MLATAYRQKRVETKDADVLQAAKDRCAEQVKADMRWRIQQRVMEMNAGVRFGNEKPLN